MDKSPVLPYDLFISHAEADRAWVQGYLLDELGLTSDRIITPNSFRLGTPLVDELERAIVNSRYIVLVLSPAYLTDQWSLLAQKLTTHLGVVERTERLIPLLLKPCDLPLQIDFRVRLDCTDDSNWGREIGRVRELLSQPRVDHKSAPCPYPGMRPFSGDECELFFGRARETQELIQRLRLHSFLAIIGPSGSGKSSLVMAGLVPALQRSSLFGSVDWTVRIIRPGSDPISTLQETVSGVVNLAKFERYPSVSGHLLFVVDQFEEAFAFPGTDISSFQQALLQLAGLPDCFVVLTARADFYPDMMSSPLWPHIQNHRVEVLPLDASGLREAIIRPAEKVGTYVEALLVERLVADAAGEPGTLPFVQETLVLLWEQAKHRFLSLSAYETLIPQGEDSDSALCTGLQVAIVRRADAVLANLTPDQQMIARRIFLRLVQFGEGRPSTRRQLPIHALRSTGDEPTDFERTLRHLVSNRLLVLDGAGRASRPKSRYRARITDYGLADIGEVDSRTERGGVSTAAFGRQGDRVGATWTRPWRLARRSGVERSRAMAS